MSRQAVIAHFPGTPAETRDALAQQLLPTVPVSRGAWQGKDAPSAVHEIDDALIKFKVPHDQAVWMKECDADDPWAEQHFLERVSGKPLNPAPSYIDWPWHSEKYREAYKSEIKDPFVKDEPPLNEQPFDHTYPERFWPKGAAGHRGYTMHGIRFDYGDLSDVVAQIKRDPFTRQAFLPVFFPEDTGATVGQRVPCTLGYHFIRNGAQLDVKYMIRSCDLTRHFRNDAYMAGRLLMWVVDRLVDANTKDDYPFIGDLTMYISNLHLFTADAWRYQ